MFTAKHCAGCHNDPAGGAPKLTGVKDSFTAAAMVSALWHHGPAMLDQMKAKEFDGRVSTARKWRTSIAYLNAKQGGK